MAPHVINDAVAVAACMSFVMSYAATSSSGRMWYNCMNSTKISICQLQSCSIQVAADVAFIPAVTQKGQQKFVFVSSTENNDWSWFRLFCFWLKPFCIFEILLLTLLYANRFSLFLPDVHYKKISQNGEQSLHFSSLHVRESSSVHPRDITHTHTHTTILQLCGICPGKPG